LSGVSFIAPLENPMDSLPDYVVASREGLFIVNRQRWRRVAHGQFFGVTVKRQDIFCFKTVALAEAAADPCQGTIARYRLDQNAAAEPEIVASGLHFNCHQIDFFDGSLFVVDTHNQCVLEFDAHWNPPRQHRILPAAIPKSAGHAHINSFLGQSDSVFLLFHNLSCGRASEIVEYDRAFQERGRFSLASAGCHDIVRLEDGSFLYCDSLNGALRRDDGRIIPIDNMFTRGLAVCPDEIAVGSSLLGQRVARALLPGYVTFLDRAYRQVARLYVPAAPTQIRRLDGADLSLSQPR
jgi:hypothetical protein